MSARETERRKRQRQASLQQEHQRRILRLRDVMLRTGLPRSCHLPSDNAGSLPVARPTWPSHCRLGPSGGRRLDRAARSRARRPAPCVSVQGPCVKST